MISWLLRLVNNKAREQHKIAVRHDKIIAGYRSVATSIGEGLDMSGLGDPWVLVRGKRMSIRDPELYHILDELEEAYAGLGYRIIPLDNWIDINWGVSIEPLWLVKREEGERPQFTKSEPERELLEPSRLVEMVWKTGKAHEVYRDENGDMQYRVVED